MKRILLLLLPLTLAFACDPNEDSVAGVPVDVMSGSAVDTSVMVKTHLGMEARLPLRMLPLNTPKIEITQERWINLRSNKASPTSTWEREALGMDNSSCSVDERCDHWDNCDGFDYDAINADGVDTNEYPVWAQSSLTSVGSGTVDNCENQPSPPNRCNGLYSGHRDYIGAHCIGCATVDSLVDYDHTLEQLVMFTGYQETTTAGTGNYEGQFGPIRTNNGHCVRVKRWANENGHAPWEGPQYPGQLPFTTGSYGDTRTIMSLTNIRSSGLDDAVSSLSWTGHRQYWAEPLRGSFEACEGTWGQVSCGGQTCWCYGSITSQLGTGGVRVTLEGFPQLDNKMTSYRMNALDPN